MVRKKKLGRVVGNYQGIRIRHVELKGGRLALYKGKKQIGKETYGSYQEALLAAKIEMNDVLGINPNKTQ